MVDITQPQQSVRELAAKVSALEAETRYLRRALQATADGQLKHQPVWKDLKVGLTSSGVHPTQSPTLETVVSGEQRQDLAFIVGNQAYCDPFHIDHDIVPGSLMYPHVHWESDHVTTSSSLTWRLYFTRAKGHQQEAFSTESYIDITHNFSSTGHMHMVTECSDAQALRAFEPDELIKVTLELQSVTGFTPHKTSAGLRIFGLMVDIHYLAGTVGTINKSPNFYV